MRAAREWQGGSLFPRDEKKVLDFAPAADLITNKQVVGPTLFCFSTDVISHRFEPLSHDCPFNGYKTLNFGFLESLKSAGFEHLLFSRGFFNICTIPVNGEK